MDLHFGYCWGISGTLSMLLAFDMLPGVFVGAHVLAELSSPTFGKTGGPAITMADLSEHEGYIRQLVDQEDLDYHAVADRLRSEKSMRVSTDVVRGYMKRLSGPFAAPSTAAIGTAAPATGSLFATVADLAVHEAYVRRLADVEGLGYKAVARRLAVDKAIRVKPCTVQNYLARLASAKRAIRIGRTPRLLPGLYFIHTYSYSIFIILYLF